MPSEWVGSTETWGRSVLTRGSRCAPVINADQLPRRARMLAPPPLPCAVFGCAVAVEKLHSFS